MNNEILYNSFLEEIVQKIVQKTDVVSTLADMLHIGKEAVYRRLRKEVPFTFYEVMTISRQLNISLDGLKMDSASIAKPFYLKQIEYVNPTELDFAFLKEGIATMKNFCGEENPETGETANILPLRLYVSYQNISKFYLFKWQYQSNKSHTAIPYKDIVIPEMFQKTNEEYVRCSSCLYTEYIFDKHLFSNLVNNITFFYSIGLITNDEVDLIRQDALKALEQIGIWAHTGIIKETGKKINIYISNVNIDTNCSYVMTSSSHLTIIKAFILNGFASTDKKTCEEMRHWIQFAKRQSVLITGSGERERLCFLEEQRNIIESLAQL